MVRIALLAVLLVLSGVASADAAERRVPRGWLGVTVDGPVGASDGREWDKMARNGVETVRTAFSWATLQPAPGASFDFAATDALVIAAARRGLALVPVVQSPPSWAAVQPRVFGSPPANPDDVRELFSALVGRYGPRGSLWRERTDLPRLPIRAWQVFNEPNLAVFWSVQPFERDYVATVRAAAAGIRADDPEATVVLGGLPNVSWGALARIYAAGGRGSFDAVAIHPYSRIPRNLVRIVRYVRGVMRANGDGALPIWVTEFSWPAARAMRDVPDWAISAFGRPLTDSEQAGRLFSAVRRFLAARERLGVARLLWYTWLSAEDPGGRDPFAYSGLRRVRDGGRRSAPALGVFRRWARRLEGCAKTTDARRCR